ncbi:PLP-dependent transferase [Pseudovirgaria hyperparasitica]|uniref:PLP-dependent transferase n=1 Tax=Pseudovirgaria hyperparasitica TaxID=470096 RepID=A0A6A6WI35_9PEZI|nr:PLP-dependent transferase [Pseudovirgaria hyperparasitica]KAF2762458.1 PLP-dependent transferase [Pseudovirgaria hyperparasitica]
MAPAKITDVASFGRPDEQDFFGPYQKGSERIASFFDSIVKLGVEFREQPTVRRDPKPTPATVQFGSLPKTGISYDELLKEFKSIADNSVNWGSPNWTGFPDAGNSVPSLGASLMIPLLNQNLANQDVCSPEATFKEMEVVHWLRSNLGYDTPEKYTNALEAGGILTIGGSLSNAIALIAAREYTFPDSGLYGLPVLPKYVRVLVPDVIEHYSIRSALSSISLGGANVVRVPVDDSFRMKLPELERCIDEERAAGRHVMACVAYAGDSRTMCIDNLDAIATILKRKNVWFHVDACHGQSLAFSYTHKHKLKGIERADSVTIDPHKVLWVTYACSFVLFKDPSTLAKVGVSTELILKTQWSLGQITPFIGSKGFDALKLWAAIKYFGNDGLSRLIDQRLALTAQIQDEVRARRNLILINETDINACIIMFFPESLQAGGQRISKDDMDELSGVNKALKMKIQDEGKYYIHGFPLRRVSHELVPVDWPVYILRTMNGNPLTSIESVKVILDEVERVGGQLWSAAQNGKKSGKAKL